MFHLCGIWSKSNLTVAYFGAAVLHCCVCASRCFPPSPWPEFLIVCHIIQGKHPKYQSAVNTKLYSSKKKMPKRSQWNSIKHIEQHCQHQYEAILLLPNLKSNATIRTKGVGLNLYTLQPIRLKGCNRFYCAALDCAAVGGGGGDGW